MKRIVFFLFCIVAILFTKHLVSHKNMQNTLLLYNIEALAADESIIPTKCLGIGTLDCPISHDKVKYIFGGYSLEGLY